MKFEKYSHGVKRKFAGETLGNDIKRVRQEPLEGFRRRVLTLPSIPRRQASDVLSELLHKVVDGDRQLVSHLLREFSLEHLPSVRNDFDKLCLSLVRSVLCSKNEQITVPVLKVLYKLLLKSDNETRRKSTLSLLKDGITLIREYPNLNSIIFAIVTDGLTGGIISHNDIPESLYVCLKRGMSSTQNSQLRVSAVKLMVAQKQSENGSNCEELEKILCEMASDRDARVRNAAVEGLFSLSGIEGALSMVTYETIRKMISDSSRTVRITVLRLLLYFGNNFGNRQITSSYGAKTKILVCDDAFSIICHGINDMEVLVRAEASRLLGEFNNVSDSFLDQTLDKKLMRTVKNQQGTMVQQETTSLFALTKKPATRPRDQRWKSWQQQKMAEKQSTSGSEWASGKDLNAPCPSGDSKCKDDKDTIMPQGACGAFVTALEDEFMSVRRSAVYSLGKLAAHRPSFANAALDHLADMFNDEIAGVRLDAIHALTPLVTHGQLQKEQLEVILKCLDDAMWESRQALRDLLSRGELSDVDCLSLVVRSLLNCLQRFPADKEKIFKCMADIGSKHGVYVHTIVNGLLDLHPIFETQEQAIDDNYYLSKLILVLNAAATYDPLVSMLPAYVLKHYRFLRAAKPHLVSSIKRVDEQQLSVVQPITKKEKKSDGTDVLLQTYDRLRDAQQEAVLTHRNSLRKFINEDALAICSFNAPLSGAARFLSHVSQLLSALESIQQTIFHGGNLNGTHEALLQERNRVDAALIQFASVDDSFTLVLEEIKFHFELLILVLKMLNNHNTQESVDMMRSAVHNLQTAASNLNIECSENAMNIVTNIMARLDSEGVDSKKILTPSTLGSWMAQYPIQLPAVFPGINSIRSKWAKITDPDKDVVMEKAIRFVAGLPLALSLSAVLHNLTPEDVTRLRIQIDYPDQARSFHKPRTTDFVTTSAGNYMLTTKVLMTSASTWTESSIIRMTLVLQTGSSANNSAVALLDAPNSDKKAYLNVKIHPMYRT